MKFTLRSNENPGEIIDIGTPGNTITAADSTQASIRALELMGLRVERADCFQYETVPITILPSGMMSEANAAKYLGYSLTTMRLFRSKSKTMKEGSHVLIRKKCPRYFRKMGAIFYKQSDLDAWINSAASDRVPSASLQRIIDLRNTRWREGREKVRDKKKMLANEAGE